MKIEIDGVHYYDYGANAGVKTILETLGFGVNEIGQTASGRVVQADIYSGPLHEESTLIGQIVRNFSECREHDFKLTFNRPSSPNRSTGKRIQQVISHLLVD